MKYFLPFAFLFFIITLLGCSSNPHPGFKQTENGLYIKYLNSEQGKKQTEDGDLMFVHFRYRTMETDSIVYDSRKDGPPLQIKAKEAAYEGDIMEGLRMLAEGDSAIFISRADSFLTFGFDLQDESADPVMIKIEATMHSITTKEEMVELLKTYAEQEKIKLKKYLKTNQITMEPTESGMYYLEIEAGEGPTAKKGDLVTVHYIGFTLDGVFFNSSYSAVRPLQFTLGQGLVIEGWDEALTYMKEGGKSRIILPSKLAYGEKAVRGSIITPYTGLVYDLELLSIE